MVELPPDPVPPDHQVIDQPPVLLPAPAPIDVRPARDDGRSGKNQKFWSWLLILAPLVVAGGIILWFQFVVLPPTPEPEPPFVVDFPVIETAATTPVTSTDPITPEDPLSEMPTAAPTELGPLDPEPNPNPAEDEDPTTGENPAEDPEPENPSKPEPVTVDPTMFQQFGRQAFINLFDNVSHLPNLTGSSLPSITGNEEVDQQLRALAKQAGYLSQPAPADSGQLVGVHRLQPLAATAWSQLEQAAVAADHPLTITVGYLAPVEQAQLLTDQLGGDLTQSSLEAAFRQVMIPGYSRHQTGFALDIVATADPDSRFQETAAYGWLAANNFALAKHFGFVPSQPENNPHGQAAHQRAFELVYIGRQHLLIGGAGGTRAQTEG